jgi:hypothetical protein
MTPQELSDRIADVMVEVTTWTADPRDWGRSDLDGAVEVWDRLDRLMTDLAVLRRDHAVVLARRVDNEQTAYTRDGRITIHRAVPSTERWEGHELLGELAETLVDTTTGERVPAVELNVLRAVIPACGQGQTSSRWKVTELRKVMENPERYREVDYGDAVIARGPIPSRVRNARPPAVQGSDTEPEKLPTTSAQDGV